MAYLRDEFEAPKYSNRAVVDFETVETSRNIKLQQCSIGSYQHLRYQAVVEC